MQGLRWLIVMCSMLVPSLALACTGDRATETLCRINLERSNAGLGELRVVPELGGAATAHASDMISTGLFSHTSADGRTLTDRLRAAGWMPDGAWMAGENLAWGSGILATPERIVRSWMESPGHRANILNGSFTEIGIGIVDGAPGRVGLVASTYATAFGHRESASSGESDAPAKAPSTDRSSETTSDRSRPTTSKKKGSPRTTKRRSSASRRRAKRRTANAHRRARAVKRARH